MLPEPAPRPGPAAALLYDLREPRRSVARRHVGVVRRAQPRADAAGARFLVRREDDVAEQAVEGAGRVRRDERGGHAGFDPERVGAAPGEGCRYLVTQLDRQVVGSEK